MYALDQLLAYDAGTGLFTWRKSPCNRALVGAKAGGLNGDGYIAIRVNGRLEMAHRLAWCMCHGEIKDGLDIDHINGDRSDNRIENLRTVSRSENNQNIRGARSNSTTGFLGVTPHKRSGLYNARIKRDGVSRSLGYFRTALEAHEAYIAAKRFLHPANTL